MILKVHTTTARAKTISSLKQGKKGEWVISPNGKGSNPALVVHMRKIYSHPNVAYQKDKVRQRL